MLRLAHAQLIFKLNNISKISINEGFGFTI